MDPKHPRTTGEQGNVSNATEGSPKTPREHGNGPKAPERTRRPAGCDRTYPNDLQGARAKPHQRTQGQREWTESTLQPPGRTRMGRKHPNEPDDSQGAWEMTERTRRNPMTPRAHANTHYRRREWTERIRTNPTIPRADGSDRTHHTPPRRTGMGRTAP